METALLSKVHLNALLDVLHQRGYTVIGPRVRGGAVMFDELQDASQMPWGVVSRQEPGRYHLEEENLLEDPPSAQNHKPRYFDYVTGPESLKRLMFAPEESLWSVSTDGEVRFNDALREAPPVAVIGARACDIAGMRVQDRTFIAGRWSTYTDPYYQARRDKVLIIAVNCTRSVPTCFCASMGTGPKVQESFDIALTELDDDFLLETGSEEGEAIAALLPLSPAGEEPQRQAQKAIQDAADSQTRSLDSTGIYALLFANLEHPRWDDVAARCLSCANCVMVCPTCFCYSEFDEADLGGGGSTRKRQWDACFTLEHGSVHGAILRPQVKQRYRQWLTHKVAAWIEQYGVSGCVGCGRCITWCPTGIDLTEEVAAIRAAPGLTA